MEEIISNVSGMGITTHLGHFCLGQFFIYAELLKQHHIRRPLSSFFVDKLKHDWSFFFYVHQHLLIVQSSSSSNFNCSQPKSIHTALKVVLHPRNLMPSLSYINLNQSWVTLVGFISSSILVLQGTYYSIQQYCKRMPLSSSITAEKNSPLERSRSRVHLIGGDFCYSPNSQRNVQLPLVYNDIPFCNCKRW